MLMNTFSHTRRALAADVDEINAFQVDGGSGRVCAKRGVLGKCYEYESVGDLGANTGVGSAEELAEDIDFDESATVMKENRNERSLERVRSRESRMRAEMESELEANDYITALRARSEENRETYQKQVDMQSFENGQAVSWCCCVPWMSLRALS